MSNVVAARVLRLALVAASVGVACSGPIGGGCAGVQPLPGGRFVGPKTDNAVNLRLSPGGRPGRHHVPAGARPAHAPHLRAGWQTRE